MYKDLFTVLGYTVQTHAVISLISIILAMGVAYGLTKDTPYNKHIGDFIIYGIIGAIIGARVWHVFVFQWPYYSQHPGEIIQIWAGGISILGAIVGGTVALLIYCFRYKITFLDIADYFAPALMLGMGVGRIACFFAGDAYGRPTNEVWGIVYPKGTNAYEHFGDTPLWPAIPFEIMGDFVIFAILYYLLALKLPKGWVLAAYYFLYGLLRFSVEYIRGDAPRLALGWTGGQWSTLIFMIFAVILGIYLFIRESRTQKSI